MKKLLLTGFLIIVLTSACYAQVEVSISAGPVSKFSTFHHAQIEAPKGKLTLNNCCHNFSGGIQANIPISNYWRLQAGVRVINKGYSFTLVFDYPNQFTFDNWGTNWGTAIEAPVTVLYELPILGRSFRFNGGVSLARNNLNKFNHGYNTYVLGPTSNIKAYTGNYELIPRKNSLTPALEAGLDIIPIFGRNFFLKFVYHYDLVPAFGAVKYKNHFEFTNSLPFVLDEPEGTIRAKRTGYFLIHFGYRLPFFDKKTDKNGPEEIPEAPE